MRTKAVHIGRRIQRLLPPERGETCCFTDYGSRKVAALLFDKQYVEPESYLAPDEVVFCDPDVQQKIEKYLFTPISLTLPNGRIPEDEEQHNVALVLHYANAVQTAFSTVGIAVLPLFSNSAELEGYCPSGPTAVYQAAIDYVPLVDDSRLSWDQVLEFRRDEDAKRKLRDFRIWARSLDQATTMDEAKDLIAQRLEDYEWAISKHGLETRMGAYKMVLDVREQISVAAAAAAGVLSGGALWGALAAGITIASKALIYVLKRKVVLQNVLRENREVALLCDLRKMATEGQTGSS